MQWHSPLQEKSYKFAVKIANFCLALQKEKREYVMTKQLLKSGTSVGANIEEASQAQSKPDFISKNSIALKEARETHYWLRLLIAAKVLPEKRLTELRDEAEEIKRILGSIIVSAKRSQGSI